MTIKEYFDKEFATKGCDIMEDVQEAVYQMYESDDDSLFHNFIIENSIDIMSDKGDEDLQDWLWDMCGE